MSIATSIVCIYKIIYELAKLLAINLLNRKGDMSMLKMFRKGNQKGFTLIELLIVVAIIGILAAIAIPQFASYRQKAFNSAAQSDIKTIKTSLEGFYTDEYYYPF